MDRVCSYFLVYYSEKPVSKIVKTLWLIQLILQMVKKCRVITEVQYVSQFKVSDVRYESGWLAKTFYIGAKRWRVK